MASLSSCVLTSLSYGATYGRVGAMAGAAFSAGVSTLVACTLISAMPSPVKGQDAGRAYIAVFGCAAIPIIILIGAVSGAILGASTGMSYGMGVSIYEGCLKSTPMESESSLEEPSLGVDHSNNTKPLL